MQIIAHSRIFLGLAALLVLLSIGAIAVWGLELGIDFTGGSLLEVTYLTERPSSDIIRQELADLSIGDVQIQPTDEGGLLLKFRSVDEASHQQILDALGKTGEIREERFESIGPVIGGELKKKAVTALVVVLVLIILYVAFAFRKVSSIITSWKYGLVTIVALIHDIVIPTGIVATIGHFGSFQVDAFFIAALLTILGFSVQDTIVVFDRFRENLMKNRGGDIATIANQSVNEVMARSINTSLTLLLVLFAVLFFGGVTVHNLVLVLIFGTFFGAYSSIFVATPLLALWNRQKKGTA